MIRFFLVAALLAGAGRAAPPGAVPAVAIPAVAIPAAAIPAAAPAVSPAAVETLQLRLLAAQQVIATLERQVSEEHNRAAALEQARLRNGHLVSIARQLVDAYAKRYGMKHSHDPLQLGRRRFEFELQALSTAIYDMDADVPLRALPGGATVAAPGAAPNESATPAITPAKSPASAPVGDGPTAPSAAASAAPPTATPGPRS